MENEKFGIELSAIVNKFKTTMKGVGEYVKNLGKEMEEDTSITPKINISINKNATRQELEKQLKDLQAKQEGILFQFSARGYPLNVVPKNTNSQYEQQLRDTFVGNQAKISVLRNHIRKMGGEIDSNNKKLDDTQKKASNTDNSLAKMFKQGISSIKRFSFYLLGARSVFSLFMRYQGIYHQYNEQMQYQTELSQNAIALSLAPAFKLLGDVISYVSIGFALFIEMLTGVNVLSKVSTKGIRDYNKSLKETQTLLGGIDEITNLTTPQTTGLLGQYQALEDFRKTVEEVRQKFEEWHVEEFAKSLKNLWGWIKENKTALSILGITIASVFGISKIGTWVMNIGTLIGVAGKGLVAGAGLLGWLAVLYGIVDMSKETIKWYKELQGDKKLAENDYTRLTEIAQELGKVKKDSKEWNELTEEANIILGRVKTKISEGNKGYQYWYDNLLKISDELDGITGETWKATIEVTYKEKWIADQKNINKNSREVREKGGLGAQLIYDQVVGKRLYDKGLDYVPYDEYPALLHKGEAVVPAKYNPTIHSQGNEYTNSLLETLVIKMDDLANRPNVFEIDGKRFANATYPLYADAKRNQGYMTNVEVR